MVSGRRFEDACVLIVNCNISQASGRAQSACADVVHVAERPVAVVRSYCVCFVLCVHAFACQVSPQSGPLSIKGDCASQVCPGYRCDFHGIRMFNLFAFL